MTTPDLQPGTSVLLFEQLVQYSNDYPPQTISRPMSDDEARQELVRIGERDSLLPAPPDAYVLDGPAGSAYVVRQGSLTHGASVLKVTICTVRRAPTP